MHAAQPPRSCCTRRRYVLHIAVSTGAPTPASLELIPTKISHKWRDGGGERPPYVSTVNLAKGEDRRWLERWGGEGG